jgi:hypothetical protein
VQQIRLQFGDDRLKFDCQLVCISFDARRRADDEGTIGMSSDRSRSASGPCEGAMAVNRILAPEFSRSSTDSMECSPPLSDGNSKRTATCNVKQFDSVRMTSRRCWKPSSGAKPGFYLGGSTVNSGASRSPASPSSGDPDHLAVDQRIRDVPRVLSGTE